MEFILLYEIAEEEKEIEISVSYSSGYDGIGHYEYWGSREYQRGHLCVEIDEITYNREGLTEEEIAAIETAISDKESDIIDACFSDIQDRKDAAEESKYESYRDRDL